MVKILSLLFKTLGEEGIQNRQGSRIPGQKWYKSKRHQVTFNNILYFKWSAPDSERGRVPHSKKQFLDTSRVSRNSTPFSYYRVSRKIIHHHWVRSQMCSDHSFSALRQLIVCLVGLQIMRLIWNLTFKTLEILLPFKTLEILLMQKFADIQLCILLGSVPSIPSPAPPFPFILKSLVQRLPPPGGSFDSKFHHHGKTVCILMLINIFPLPVWITVVIYASLRPRTGSSTQQVYNSYLLSKALVLLWFLFFLDCRGCLCVIHK